MAKKYTVSKSHTKKDTKEILKLGLILVCYSVVLCTVLAVVNYFTAPKIASNQNEKAKAAMQEVFAVADNFELDDDSDFYEQNSTSSIKVKDFYFAKKDGNVIGGVIQVTGPTYDKGKIIVAMDLDSVVTGVRILELSDSPGFGLKANSPSFTLPSGKTFYGQFEGKSATDGFKDGQNFDAISGATITSKGLGDMIDTGVKAISFKLSKAGVLKEEGK